MKKYISIIGIVILVLVLASCSGQNSLAGTYTVSPGLIGGSSNELILMKDGTGMISTEQGRRDTFTWEYIKDTIYFKDLDMFSNTILSGTVNIGKQFTVISINYNNSVYNYSLEKTGSAPNKLPESAPEIKNNTSALKRVKLLEKSTVNIGYIDDKLGLISNKSTVENSMKKYHELTGVMPHLVITDDIGGASTDSEAQTYTQNLYAKLFGTDQTHFLIVWYQKNGYDDYVYMHSGTSANGVVDADARDVIMNYMNRYYSAGYEKDEYFSKVFEDSATEIML